MTASRKKKQRQQQQQSMRRRRRGKRSNNYAPLPGLRDQKESREGEAGSARVALRGRSLRKLVSINIQHSFLHFKFRGNTLSKARPSPGYASPVSPPLALACSLRLACTQLTHAPWVRLARTGPELCFISK